jgi:LDH2 family malate/lactate/ureidoglycolate dehydrogenase
MRASERMPGVDRIWLPGEQSHARRARYAKDGIPISAVLLDELNALARDSGIAPLAAATAG